MKKATIWVPVVIVALAGINLAKEARPPARDWIGLDAAGKIPVVDGGRVKPLDTVARISLRSISGRETFPDAKGDSRPAIQWYLDIAGKHPLESEAADYPVFRIDNDQVLLLLGLKQRTGFRYALKEFGGRYKELTDEAKRAERRPQDKRELYDIKVLDTRRSLETMLGLSQLHQPRVIPPVNPGEDWRSIGEMREAALNDARSRVLARNNINAEELQDIANEKARRLIKEVLEEQERIVVANPFAKSWLDLLASYRVARDAHNELVKETGSTSADPARISRLREKRDSAAKAFDDNVASWRDQMGGKLAPREARSIGLETFVNRFAPFYQCLTLYVLAFLVACGSWIGWAVPLRRSAIALLIVTVTLHTAALGLRMYIHGRPPVTNLYSSAIFIGWASVLMGLVIEKLFPLGVGASAGAFLGFLTSIIAHGMAASGDTLEMMRAVLDTNFWLATHVTVVTLGYSATAIAGSIGAAFIIFGLLTPKLDAKLFKALGSINYGVLCFATMLSFVGTVLGGFWADYSWGRFWGWDPKENGALMIVLWNAVVLHARWGGMVKQRGVAVLSVFGNIVVAWSYFGTNLLGVGLHSYGFTSSGIALLIAWNLANLVVIGLGSLIPPERWSSFGGQFDSPTGSGVKAAVRGRALQPAAR